MFTRNVEISATSFRSAPALARMSRTFSMTARVWVRMSKRIVPEASTSAPAMVLSGRRALVPETNKKGPARLICGKRPRGAAFPPTTLASMATTGLSVSESNTNVVQLRIEIQRMHSAFAADAGEPHSAEWRSQVAQEPAIDPGDAHIHLPCHSMSPLQIGRPDRCRQTILGVIRHRNRFLFRIERSNVAHRTEDLVLDAGGGLRQSRQNRRSDIKPVVARIAKNRNAAPGDNGGAKLSGQPEVR